jgi:two-component system alkaline phosphatase synthesis response regulator PhoP
VAKILIIEDNQDLAEGLRVNLELEQHEVVICADGADAISAVIAHQPNLILLDVMLPNQDGFRILQELQTQLLEVPVLMLTARGEEADKVRALRLGADDYVTKPFGLMELIARIEALLRRSYSDPGEAKGRQQLFARVEVDRATRRVWRDGVQVNLTPRELDLLLILADLPNQALSRQELLKKVWGHRAETGSRTVDTHIAELRRKLEDDPANPRYLRTARSAGYWLDLDSDKLK